MPNYVPSDLHWYKRDGLMTWYNQKKCKKFLKNPQENFEKTNIANFDIINRQIRGEKISDEFLKEYQTVQEKRVSQYLKKECQNFLACVLRRTGSISIFFKKAVLDLFKNLNK